MLLHAFAAPAAHQAGCAAGARRRAVRRTSRRSSPGSSRSPIGSPCCRRSTIGTWRRSTAGPRSWRCRPIARGSACRSWRRFAAGRPSSPAISRFSAKSAAAVARYCPPGDAPAWADAVARCSRPPRGRRRPAGPDGLGVIVHLAALRGTDGAHLFGRRRRPHPAAVMRPGARVRIVHAAKFYPPVPGGMETVVKDLCDGTAGEWDVRVVAANTSRGDRCRTRGRRDRHARRCAREGALGAPLPVAAVASVAGAPPTVSSFTNRTRLPAPRSSRTRPRQGSSIWHHSDLLRPSWAPATYGRLQRAMYRRAACVIVSSPPLAAGSELVRHARRVEVIPFGIRLDRFRHLNDRQRALAELIRAPAS